MKFFVCLSLCLLGISCSNPSSESALNAIHSLQTNKNLAMSDSLINSMVRFTNEYPSHDSAMQVLFTAASLSIQTNKIAKGARLYERVAMEFKNDSIAPKALIRAATAFASIPDQANAKRLYDYFILTYPNHPRIEEVKMWSLTSGMSEEQLMKFFKEKIEKKDSSSL